MQLLYLISNKYAHKVCAPFYSVPFVHLIIRIVLEPNFDVFLQPPFPNRPQQPSTPNAHAPDTGVSFIWLVLSSRDFSDIIAGILIYIHPWRTPACSSSSSSSRFTDTPMAFVGRSSCDFVWQVVHLCIFLLLWLNRHNPVFPHGGLQYAHTLNTHTNSSHLNEPKVLILKRLYKNLRTKTWMMW